MFHQVQLRIGDTDPGLIKESLGLPRIDGDQRKVKLDSVRVGAQRLAAWRVKQRSQLAQAPAQGGAWVVGSLPHELAQSLAADRASLEGEMGKQGPRLAGLRQITRQAIALEGHRAQEAEDERSRVGCHGFSGLKGLWWCPELQFQQVDACRQISTVFQTLMQTA
ncbi:hypothetical protein [Polaromonas sp. CG_9.11]|uniref:hypothetical protein n=1 Tax=Polaromonas sp. CG_9.11 TaxID=2787730 RepID=UPI0018C968FA|nr:hypothetical protein [Polaromonas sp. CG_9.11]MBG6077646.1 hypothetical protein [Polaromonas sp. CG_9.11]